MFSVQIPDHIDEMIMPNLYHWKKVKHLINKVGGEVVITNTTVETKLHAANFFLYLLSEASKHHGFEASFLRRTAFESMILNLNAAIESVAHMLNLIYGINIFQIKVSIDHISKKNDKRHKDNRATCLRCRLADIDSDLNDALNEHLKRESPIHDWYEALRQYRNQIIHRHHSIYLLSGGKTYLPDDPSIYQTTEKPRFDFANRDIIVPNYTLKREILKYSQELFSHVLIVIEVIYYSITVHEKFKENFD